MGVYIKNMEKPKGCRWCPLNHDSMCYVIQPYKTDETNGEQCRNNCPLIEIDLVRCGECKYMRKYALRSDEPTGIWCHRWSVPRLVTDDDFCSYGEGRE